MTDFSFTQDSYKNLKRMLLSCRQQYRTQNFMVGNYLGIKAKVSFLHRNSDSPICIFNIYVRIHIVMTTADEGTNQVESQTKCRQD